MKFIDLFAGCGGLSLGLCQAGMEGVFAVERDTMAFRTFASNFLSPESRAPFQWPSWLQQKAWAIDELLSTHKAELLALRGRVLAADGTPATRLHVYATAERDPADPKLFSYAEAEPDADGRFELTGLVPGPYRVTIAADHGDARAVPQEPLHVVLAADTPELTLTMPVTGELRGVLRDAGGHAIDRAMVMLAGSADAQHVLAGDDGSFLFPAVAPRDYHLIARRNSQRLAGATLDGQPVTITAGGLTTTTAIVAAPDQRLTGLVRDAASAPVAGAFVVLRSRSQQLLAPPVETDAAGRFTVAALAPGKYRVRAYRRGGGEALTDAVEAGSDLTLTLAAP